MESQTESLRATVQLPGRLSEAFQALRRGRHICRVDGAVWFDLKDHLESYQTIFNALGYETFD